MKQHDITGTVLALFALATNGTFLLDTIVSRFIPSMKIVFSQMIVLVLVYLALISSFGLALHYFFTMYLKKKGEKKDGGNSEEGNLPSDEGLIPKSPEAVPQV